MKDEECGKWLLLGVCSSEPEKHDKIPITHSCNRLVCPVCYKKPLLRAAEASAQRIDGYRFAQLGQVSVSDLSWKQIYPPRHFMISPPIWILEKVAERTQRAIDTTYLHPDDFGRIFIEKYRYEAYKAVRVAGLDGAAHVAHLYRIQKEVQDYVNSEFIRLGMKDRWEYVISQSDWQDLVSWSPHSHLVGYGTAMPTRQFYKASGGWTIRMIREASVVQSLMYYLFSHTPVVGGRLCVTYLGCVSPRKLRCVETKTTREEVLCSVCGAVVVYQTVNDDGTLGEIQMERPLVQYRKTRYYTICPACGFKKVYKPLKRVRRTYD